MGKTDRFFLFSAEACVQPRSEKDCCAIKQATMRLAAAVFLLPAIVSGESNRRYQITVISTTVAVVTANELSRCCSGGSRHYGQTKTCTNIRTEGTSTTCLKSANICCLRALLDDRCNEGTNQARDDEYCPARIDELGGGFRKV